MRRVGAVLFPDFEMLDLFGPLQLYSMHRQEFEIVTVAERAGPCASSGGPDVSAQYSLADCPKIDVLLVPGGKGTRSAAESTQLLEWLNRVSKQCELTTSVCTGAVLLARANVLDGRKATTNKNAFDWVTEQSPSNIDWQRRARWVEDENVFTASGVSAGMDMTLAAIRVLIGSKAAEDAALWAEYTPHLDKNNDPFALEGTQHD